MLSIVIPTYNERRNLKILLPQILHQLALEPTHAEVLIVDSASPDGTSDIVRFYQRRFPHRLHLVEEPVKQGLGSAYRLGFLEALKRGATHIVQMDADGSHDYKDISRLLAPLTKNEADVVIGSRYTQGGQIENWKLSRRIISRGGSFYARTLLQSPIRDLTSGFRAWNSKALAMTAFPTTLSNGYGFQIEMARRAEKKGARILELPIAFTDRKEGHSKFSGKIFKEAAVLPWRI